MFSLAKGAVSQGVILADASHKPDLFTSASLETSATPLLPPQSLSLPIHVKGLNQPSLLRGEYPLLPQNSLARQALTRKGISLARIHFYLLLKNNNDPIVTTADFGPTWDRRFAAEC